MPPPASSLYRNVPGVGRVKTTEYKSYEREVCRWATINMHQLELLREFVRKVNSKDHCLGIVLQAKFFFERKSILNKENRPKKMDLDNRLKAALDCLFAVLHIDDKYVWDLRASKNLTQGTEHVNFHISLTNTI